MHEYTLQRAIDFKFFDIYRELKSENITFFYCSLSLAAVKKMPQIYKGVEKVAVKSSIILANLLVALLCQQTNIKTQHDVCAVNTSCHVSRFVSICTKSLSYRQTVTCNKALKGVFGIIVHNSLTC